MADVMPEFISTKQDKIQGSEQSVKVPIEEEKKVAMRVDIKEEAKVEQWPRSPRSPIVQERQLIQNFVRLLEEQKGNKPDIKNVVDTDGSGHGLEKERPLIEEEEEKLPPVDFQVYKRIGRSKELDKSVEVGPAQLGMNQSPELSSDDESNKMQEQVVE